MLGGEGGIAMGGAVAIANPVVTGGVAMGAEPPPKKPRGGAGETEVGGGVVLKNVRWCGSCGKQFPNPSALVTHM